nr:hypothetical protein [Tanacetum cinerariifolium]
MGNEELNTIPEKKSNEFIKSSVGDLVPILSESEETSGSESVCILPSCDNDDESLSDEDVPEDNVKIYSNSLFEFDDEYISSDVNPFFDEINEIENVSHDRNLLDWTSKNISGSKILFLVLEGKETSRSDPRESSEGMKSESSKRVGWVGNTLGT